MDLDVRVLFVCLGNICRSPMAEGAMRKAASEAGLGIEVDSAGTGAWHIGNPPDPRAIATAERHGVDISRLCARQICEEDYTRFTHIFALDRDNLATIRGRRPRGSTSEIGLLLDMVPGREGQAVADPYYGDDEGFELAWREVSEAAVAIVGRFSTDS